MSRRTAVVALTLALAVRAGALLAQDTREATLARQRAEKSTSLEPYEGGKLERAMLWFEAADPMRRIAPHDGFYLQYGFKWKPVGGGIGVGGGWRHDLFNRNARVLLGGGISTRNYQMLQADFSLVYFRRGGDTWSLVGLERN